MSQLLVHQYLAEIDRLRKFSGSITEGVISEAFKDLLKAWSRQNNLHFISQYEFVSPQKNRIRPDGTILHDLRVPLGYWEAKDIGDDLDVEIRKKLAKGYPQDNIIFENSVDAVLIQNRNEVLRCSMTDTGALLKLVTLFFKYEREEIRDFRKAVQQFKQDIPAVLAALRERIDAAYAENDTFQKAATIFLQHAKDTINPSIGEADVREMLIQHILTEEIFAHVFDQSDFHRENNIAKELYALEAKFFTGQVKRETLKSLETYYATIRANAALITSHSEKQTFLKLIYENFYKVYNPKAADRLGVVYTPNEIVKFMIEGADWLTQKHFGKALIDPNVEILDPATGTGTFICELLEHFRGQPQKLAHKYKNELFANEVAILPYYVANLNIEATYAAISGQFAEFPNLCFVDTLDNIGGLGIKAGQHVGDLFGALSDENIERVKRQNNQRISVVIGNPPYNAGQLNEINKNKNRNYDHIDDLIRNSYVRHSNAQKTLLYDMYARFFRWASDRMHDNGVLAFVTNRSFIESRTFDGFRKAVVEEFSEIYVVDLGGDIRANPKLSGTKHNVFGIQTGVAISFMVKCHKQTGCRIFYVRRPEMDTAEDKLAFLGSNPAAAIAFQRVEPDKAGNWVNLNENDWDEFIPVADKKTKAARTKGQEKAIFKNFSTGIMSGRDEWVYDFSEISLENKMAQFSSLFKLEVRSDADSNSSFKTSRNIRRKIGRNDIERMPQFNTVIFRPFTRKSLFLSRVFVDETGSMIDSFASENIVISFLSVASSNNISTFVSNTAVDYGLLKNGNGGTQCLFRYRYTASDSRVDNITDWALKQFRQAYGPSTLDQVEDAASASQADRASGPRAISPSGGEIGRSRKASERTECEITKDDIFHYVYAVLHDPVYRETYALNLKREFPRIPFYPDFRQWAAWGERLMGLHIGYETVEPWPLTRLDTPDEKARAAGLSPKPVLKADQEAGIIRLDSETQLSGIPPEVWTYRLGNRSSLEWILDQHKEKTPKDPTIREKFNTYRFADYKEKVVDLLTRVTRVSVETVAITEAMKAAKR